jgi:hypothetical protein
MIEWQAALTLPPPDVDPNDARYEDRMKAWAERLARAVEAEIVTRDKALTAWRRAVTHEPSAAAA